MSLLTVKKINQGQLLKLLITIGYINVRANGVHLIFKHDKTKSLIVLRHRRKNEIIPNFIVASVYRNIIDNKIMTNEELYLELVKILDK